jgi:GT2 family glycosyltransferase
MVTISVVIPTYNRAEELRVCLTSVLGLDRGDRVEVIVVDDGSTDATRSIVEAFGGGIRYLAQENAGPCVARNRGADVARGDFVAFLDSDDELLPGWATHMLDLLGASGVAMACCGVTIEWNHGGRSNHMPTPAGPAFGEHRLGLLPGAYTVSRDLFRRAGGFAEDIPYGEHHELGLRLTAELRPSEQVASVQRALVIKHHDRSAAVRSAYHRQRLEAAERIVERHAQQLRRDSAMLASYEVVAASSAASLGDYRRARSHYLRAIRVAPTRWKPYAGWAVATVPGVRRLVWASRVGGASEQLRDGRGAEVR